MWFIDENFNIIVDRVWYKEVRGYKMFSYQKIESFEIRVVEIK